MSSQVTVKVLSYNVYMRNQIPNSPVTHLNVYNKQRAAVIPDFIINSDIDVVVFQEAFDDGARDIIIRRLRTEGKFHHSTYVVGYEDSTLRSDGGIFIMSRPTIAYQGQIVFEEGGTSWDKYAKKGVSWAVVEKNGCYFNVFGTHTQSGGGTSEMARRHKQLVEVRGMIDKVGLYWQPALIVGDLNIDYCNAADYARGFCSNYQRVQMLETLKAAMPKDVSGYTYTSAPENFHIKDDHKPTTLDYVLFSTTHPQPLRSSIETLKPRGLVEIPRFGKQEMDLSDHYAVLATATFEKKREDTMLFTGEWKRVLLNGRPDAGDCLVTFGPFGFEVVGMVRGRVTTRGRIEQMTPGGGLSGTFRLRNDLSGQHEQWQYSLNKNRDYERYFVPGDTIGERRPRPYNELVLRGPNITQTFAFVRWPENEGTGLPDRP